MDPYADRRSVLGILVLIFPPLYGEGYDMLNEFLERECIKHPPGQYVLRAPG